MNVAQLLIYIFDALEYIVRKGENAYYQHFVFFPHNVFRSLLQGH